jgi:hypothetical protein
MNIVRRFGIHILNAVLAARSLITLITLFCLATIVFAEVTGRVSDGPSNAIKSAFDPKLAQWNIDWPGRVAQHDLVYKSPPIDPMQGIPLGNGDVAALAWCEGSKLIMVLNKCDLWDDSKTGKSDTWDEKYDYYTTQRQACRIEVDFKFPVFNTLYLSDFRARLNLADASMSLRGASPFGEVRLNTFIDHRSGILFCDLGMS